MTKVPWLTKLGFDVTLMPNGKRLHLQLIAAHLETFLARQRERDREVPHFVERKMRAYLSCGVLACGLLRLKCESCGKDRLLPLAWPEPGPTPGLHRFLEAVRERELPFAFE